MTRQPLVLEAPTAVDAAAAGCPAKPIAAWAHTPTARDGAIIADPTRTRGPTGRRETA